MIKEINMLIDEKLLNKHQAIIFIIFLKLEKKRHLQDINKINETIKYLFKKFKI